MLDLINSIDYKIFNFINKHVEENLIIDNMMIFLAEYAQFLFPIVLIVFWLLNKGKGRIFVFQTTLAFGIAFTLTKFIKMLFYRDRPFVSHLDINQLVDHSINSSFPSNHATSALVIAVSIYLFYKRLGIACLIIALGIAFSRIWVGVHYPVDVIVGIIFGSCISLLVHHYFRRFEHHLNNFAIFHEKIK
ncbi:TPA: undecaprenyl-diphosphatase [Bacillus cereus]